MTRLSRIGLAAAVAVFLAGTPVARAAEPDKLLPPDSDTAIYVNVKQILDSEIIKKYALEQMKQALDGNDAKKFLADLGLDPLKDVDTVVIGGYGKDQTDIKGLVIFHGKFDPEKLYKAAEAQTRKDADHFSLIKDGKDVMFKFQPDNGNPVYGTVIDEKTVVLGSEKKMISTALAAASAEGKKPAINKDLTALIGKMDDKSSVWIAAVLKDKLDKVKLPGGPGGNPNLQAQLPNLDTVTIVVKITGDVTLDVTMAMKDADAAEEMGKAMEEMIQTIKGVLPFIVAQNPQMKPLQDAVKSLKSTVKDKSVNLSGKLTGAAIGAMLKMGE
jgi:hypothetical protein